jgi:hypothetical protein
MPWMPWGPVAPVAPVFPWIPWGPVAPVFPFSAVKDVTVNFKNSTVILFVAVLF